MGKGIKIFDATALLGIIKNIMKHRTERKIKKDLKLAEDVINDHNNIETLLFVSYTIKTFKLVILIINISYFIGMIWLIFCEISEDLLLYIRSDLPSHLSMHLHSDFFLEVYNLETFDNDYESDIFSIFKKALIATYYAFTSLSTVGFGDFTPQSDPERLLCSFILLFGVAIFSYIMGNFIEILDQFKTINEDLDDGDNLSRFFGLLQRFNRRKVINQDLKDKIQAFFDYKWKFDKN